MEISVVFRCFSFCSPTPLLVCMLLHSPACGEPVTALENVSLPMAAAEATPPINTADVPPGTSSELAGEESLEETVEEFHFPLEDHLWAKFLPGAWREIEITSQTFNPTGESTGQSVTTQREVLQAIAEDSYLLQTKATVDYSGRTIDVSPSTQALRLLTDQVGQIFQTIQRPEQLLEFGEDSTTVKVWDVIYHDEAQNLRERLFFSADVFPHILRRDVYEHVEEVPVEQVPMESSLVIAREVPFHFQEQTTPCACVRTIRRHTKGSTVRLEMMNPEVPGGEVISWSTDFDTEGHRVRWTVQKTTSYGLETAQ